MTSRTDSESEKNNGISEFKARRINGNVYITLMIIRVNKLLEI